MHGREGAEDGGGAGPGVDAEAREADGEDVVDIGSDGEERQMEDLFRAAGQVRRGGGVDVPAGSDTLRCLTASLRVVATYEDLVAFWALCVCLRQSVAVLFLS